VGTSVQQGGGMSGCENVGGRVDGIRSVEGVDGGWKVEWVEEVDVVYVPSFSPSYTSFPLFIDLGAHVHQCYHES
jgi:hypothetical protein